MPTVTVDGTTMHYLDAGSGLPVVLLHAFPLDGRMWEGQVAALEGRARLVVPDLKGFGRSDVPEDPSAYSVEGWADDVMALVGELGLGRVVVGGLSMGGYVALAFARRHAGALRGLVLADTRAEADTPERREQRSQQQRKVAEGQVDEVVEKQLEVLLAETTRQERPEVVASVRELMDQSPAGFIGALEAMKKRPDVTPDLEKIDVPTLVVVGEEDKLSSPEVAESMRAAIPDCRLSVLPGAGHLSNIEAPEAFNEALSGLLSEL